MPSFSQRPPSSQACRPPSTSSCTRRVGVPSAAIAAHHAASRGRPWKRSGHPNLPSRINFMNTMVGNTAQSPSESSLPAKKGPGTSSPKTPSRMSSCACSCAICAARGSASMALYMQPWMVVTYMSWRRLARRDRARSSGVSGTKDGPSPANLSTRYSLMVSDSGRHMPSAICSAGILPSGLTARYPGSLSPPKASRGDRIATRPSRPLA
mmetsp:Transcript_3686/g.10104  ORF Transcript_3686/g.10104 Transcript_3686/m.10104 type:complete len:210 (-) Transcript_3686:78-707(-)